MTRILTGLVFVLSVFFINHAFATEITSAACVIHHGPKILMVHGPLSKRYSLPGGYREPGESVEQNALRETLEETGVKAKIIEKLGVVRQTQFFLCQSLEPLRISQSKFLNNMTVVHGYNALHFGKEIDHLILLQPDKLEKSLWRFQDNYQAMMQWREKIANANSDSAVILQADFKAQFSTWHQREAGWVAGVQSLKSPLMDKIFGAFNFSAEKKFMFIMIPIIWAFFSWQIGARFLLIISLASISSTFFKNLFQLPRPFHLEPLLQQISASSYGFPSGHTILSTVFWSAVCYYLAPKAKRVLVVPAAGLLIAAVGIARMYWGAHMLSDVVAGAILGLLLITLFITLEKQFFIEKLLKLKLSAIILWFAVFCLPLIVLFPDIQYIEMLALNLGLFIGLIFSDKLHTISIKAISTKLAYMFIAIFGLFAINSSMVAYQAGIGNAMHLIETRALTMTLLALCLSLGAYLPITLWQLINRKKS